jgi:hypothetical protein
MTPSDWLTVLGVSLVTAAVVTGVSLWLLDGRLRREQSCSLQCPHLGTNVECRVLQDIRTGQWKAVNACSAFTVPEQIQCDVECARLVNLGQSGYRLVRN